MNISQQQISYILQLIEYKNFGKAAEACFVTQPTLSMQIKKAEEILGFQIFNRNRNPIELTSFGKKLAPILYDMQGEYEKIKRLAESNSGEIIEEIKIGIIPTVAAYMVPTLFENKEHFSKHIKWAIYELKSVEILEQLQHKKIDLGIMAGPVNDDNLSITNLYNEEILVYTSQGEKRTSIDIAELKNLQPWLLNHGNCLRTQMVHFCKLNEDRQPDWNYEGGNIEMLTQMADRYGGYTLIPAFYEKCYSLKQAYIHRLNSNNKEVFPARNIIGLTSHKNKKHTDLVQLLNFIKLEYANQEMKKFEILSWT